MPHTTDLDVTPKEVVELASPDAITAFLGKLGYDTADRTLLSPEAVGLSGESASAIKRIELLSEDPEQFLRVVFAQPKSLTAKVKRGKQAEVVVRKKEVYLSNDKAERKASGSYYTPAPIVEYIVANTVGPVLEEKLEALRGEFRKVRKTFDNEQQKSQAYPSTEVQSGKINHRQWAGLQTYNAHKDLVESLFDLRVLDPAMGSGHFLVETVDFVTDHLLKFLNQFPINPVNFALDRTRTSILESLGEQGVSVDPARLTDINLLKRHVLKRCIYGVDLNPMAVELAKVSLWLDAFTLGAPLSFLDHHLRCGNSLIGAMFKDLEAATADRPMFSIKYEPLLRAINHVLFVSKMADATAAEVARSAGQYDQARTALSGYRIVLDLLVAQHFGLPQAAALVTDAAELDLANRDRFLASLHGETERQLVAEVEDLAQRPARRFFHWEIEFPEVFFGFVEADQRQIKHKDRIAEGSAGFDVVVGNPPYVRQESIKALKDYLRSRYSTFEGRNDIYVYFQELEIRMLRLRGRLGMIVSNKWMRTSYGTHLRSFLLGVGLPLEVVDFGHAPVFPDADTFPCILVMTHRGHVLAKDELPGSAEMMHACSIPRERWDPRMDLGRFVSTRRYPIPTRLLRHEGWSLEDPRVQTLLQKLRNAGVSLSEYCGSKPFRGVLTGFNEAFVIDEATRIKLIQSDPRCENLIKPLLRGRDVSRWLTRCSGLYLIYVEWDTPIQEYPSVMEHLRLYFQQLNDRVEVREGRHPWWSFSRYAAGHSHLFDRPKLLWQEIQFHSWFARDVGGPIVNNKVFFVPSDDLALLGVLCSPLMWWHLTRVLPHMKDEALSPAGFMMEGIHLTTGGPQQNQGIRETVELLLVAIRNLRGWEDEAVKNASRKFGTALADENTVNWLYLSADSFVARVLKSVSVKQPTAKLRHEIGTFYHKYRTRQVELLTRQLDLEKTLAVAVEDAYGLTPEERTLLRATRPVRDPLDVLEAKIRGGNEVVSHPGSQSE